MIAMLVLTVGVLGLVGVTAMGVHKVSSSSSQIIAREKAREAVESVHAARDTGRLSWPNIRNVPDGGIFLAGTQSLKLPGADGIVNTADDTTVETLRKPGTDGLLGTADDEVMPLADYTREVRITPVNIDGTAVVNDSLRQITVNVGYRVDGVMRTYTLTTYISSYS